MSTETTPFQWEKPKEVTRLDLAFGGCMKDLLPPMADIPEEFKGWNGTKWNRIQSEWFYNGIKGAAFHPKEGIDKDAALAHLKAIQGSWEPKHEHKGAGVSWLMSLWFDDITLAGKERA